MRHVAPLSPIAAQTAAPRRWLSIVGIGEDGADGLTPVARGLIADAEIVFGGKRHLQLAGAAYPRRGAAVAEPIRPRGGRGAAISAAAASACSPRAIRFSMASARCWQRHVVPDEMLVVPAPSAFSLAAARLGWALQDTACFRCTAVRSI